MKLIQKIKADVQCHWSEIPPVYRLYIDNELFTERTFGWPGYQTYIREIMVAELDQGIHKLKIENCSGHGTIRLTNFLIENNPDALHPNQFDPSGQEITFIVRP